MVLAGGQAFYEIPIGLNCGDRKQRRPRAAERLGRDRSSLGVPGRSFRAERKPSTHGTERAFSPARSTERGQRSQLSPHQRFADCEFSLVPRHIGYYYESASRYAGVLKKRCGGLESKYRQLTDLSGESIRSTHL